MRAGTHVQSLLANTANARRQRSHITVHGMTWYGMVWYGMVWYGMAWYGMVWYGMVW